MRSRVDDDSFLLEPHAASERGALIGQLEFMLKHADAVKADLLNGSGGSADVMAIYDLGVLIAQAAIYIGDSIREAGSQK